MAAKTRTTVLVCIVVLSVGEIALATPVITEFSSTVTSGTATNKANDQDLMYLMTQNGVVTYQVTATGAEAYEWQVNKTTQAGATGLAPIQYLIDVPPKTFRWILLQEGQI